MPNPESSAPQSQRSSQAEPLLSSYIRFLTIAGEYHSTNPIEPVHSGGSNRPNTKWTATVVNTGVPEPPLASGTTKTALLLVDFQALGMKRCGMSGRAALAKGKMVRDWALARELMVVHSITDIHGILGQANESYKGTKTRLARITGERDAAEEPTEIAFSQAKEEFIVLKQPGTLSALKSTGLMELLREHEVKSLVLCGLTTSGAILTTATSAANEGFAVIVLSDACADSTSGEHDSSVENILRTKAHVATAETFIDRWAQ